MMISPEGYYEEYLKGKSAEHLQINIHNASAFTFNAVGNIQDVFAEL
ncbi:MAG: hypothetical protein J5988_11380 [Eubacterium sp.]|nr:hypothetical protein [Eubacterium sp.]